MSQNVLSDNMRIAKFLSHAGVASRRQAEVLLSERRIKINDTVVIDPAYKVQPQDEVYFDNQPVRVITTTEVWAFYKPKLVITSQIDAKRTTVFSLLPKNMPRVVSVGRLDYNSEGLLLLTNDPSLAHRLEQPKNGYKRTYRVRVYGQITPLMIDKIAKGITVEGINYGPIEMEPVDFSQARNQWWHVSMHEGKNREIRKVLGHFDLRVNRLIRTQYASVKLGKMQPGELRKLTASEVSTL